MDNQNRNFQGNSRAPKPIEITKQQLQILKIKSKQLDPLVRIGKAGLSPGATMYIQNIMHAHGLVKFKVLKNATDNCELDTIIEEAASKCNAILIDRIGLTFTLYHPFSKHKNLLR